MVFCGKKQASKQTFVWVAFYSLSIPLIKCASWFCLCHRWKNIGSGHLTSARFGSQTYTWVSTVKPTSCSLAQIILLLSNDNVSVALKLLIRAQATYRFYQVKSIFSVMLQQCFKEHSWAIIGPEPHVSRNMTMFQSEKWL